MKNKQNFASIWRRVKLLAKVLTPILVVILGIVSLIIYIINCLLPLVCSLYFALLIISCLDTPQDLSNLKSTKEVLNQLSKNIPSIGVKYIRIRKRNKSNSEKESNSNSKEENKFQNLFLNLNAWEIKMIIEFFTTFFTNLAK